ncbi:MAG: B12-binding domain-containing radical SAM protein [Desulfobacca sp.]|uniref:B12-binding domain-containing radical SAM protein n=1 Tax=Desulfobacca sp. TaxID=2067990 RepID=UPI00404A909D
MADVPFVLCLNPWVYDFAAHDFFARPLGLLSVAGRLRAAGYRVAFLDCASRPGAGPSPTGRWPKEMLPSPPALQGVPRRYGRYGLSLQQVQQALAALPQPPHAVLVTSLMTYWYPGVQATIAVVREHFPQVPVLLGGIYATLLPDHARAHSGADVVITGPGEEAVPAALADLTGFPGPSSQGPEDAWPDPAYDLLADRRFLPLLTSRGCPFDCDYCASRLLTPAFRRRRPDQVLAEIRYWHDRFGVRDVAFYDDALLVAAEQHLLPILEGVVRLGLPLRFHTPNALHLGLITPRLARWLKRANFATLRLGLETTANGPRRRDRKIRDGDLERGVAALREAGFTADEIGVYLLIGLPHQDDEEVVAAIRAVRQAGGTPVLAQYSPIPGTALWPEAVQVSRYDLTADPIFQNNSIFPCWPEFSWERYTRLKNLAAGRV